MIIDIYRTKVLNGEETESELLQEGLEEMSDALSFISEWLLENDFDPDYIDWFLEKVSKDQYDYREQKTLSQHIISRHYSRGGRSLYGLRVDVSFNSDEVTVIEPEEENEEEP